MKHKNDLIKRLNISVFMTHQSGFVFPVSLTISRKRNRQLGNHSLFTVGLEGRGGGEEVVGKEEGGG